MRRHILKLTLAFIIILVGSTMVVDAIKLSNEPVGDLHAKRGGQLNLCAFDFPKSFNAMVDGTLYSHEVFDLVYDTLMTVNDNTLGYEPLIAKSLETSADKKEFTVKIDPRAKWADGKPITADDILFTFDTIMNPKNMTSIERMFYSRFNRPKKIDQYTVKFIAKTVHYNNLIAIAGFTVLPKHLFEGKDFNKSFSMSLPPGSGPYTLSEVKEGRYYVLTRRKNYWADQLPYHLGMYNFERIKYKVIRDDNVAFEAFKRGDFDIFDSIDGKRWATEANSEHFQKNWIVKQKIHNYAPYGFFGLAINMRKPMFQDLRVRQALAYLLDRKTIIAKLEYNEYKPLTSYWPYLYGNQAANFPMNYDPVKAKQLLKEAGYNRLDSDGYLINQKGERLEFTIYYAKDTDEKRYTLYADTCKQAGVKVNLELLSWATLTKKTDEYKFDMVSIGWTASLFGEPEQLWHSKHANEVGGSNLTGYKNPEVDRLIDSMPPIYDAAERNQIIKKIDALIYRDVPYVLTWTDDSSRIFYKNIFGMPKTVFPKYSTGAISYWWYDPVKIKRYQEAVKKKKALPAESVEIYYDKLAK
ncbi:MAG TPA: ABC transporter substrate-binding protein [Firmicutes bacterium]|jgi:microcin C transport system substrate-binding protein|nr:ABC transporter substrate-binding protein [Bacillota bacterium]